MERRSSRSTANDWPDLPLRDWADTCATVRRAQSPDDDLMQYLRSTYEAAADGAHWDRSALERTDGKPAPSEQVGGTE